MQFAVLYYMPAHADGGRPLSLHDPTAAPLPYTSSELDSLSETTESSRALENDFGRGVSHTG